MQDSVPRPGQVIERTNVLALPSTTLSGGFPTIKSSNDGPSSRVEVNEGFVGAEAEAVANERMAILEDC